VEERGREAGDIFSVGLCKKRKGDSRIFWCKRKKKATEGGKTNWAGQVRKENVDAGLGSQPRTGEIGVSKKGQVESKKKGKSADAKEKKKCLPETRKKNSERWQDS